MIPTQGLSDVRVLMALHAAARLRPLAEKALQRTGRLSLCSPLTEPEAEYLLRGPFGTREYVYLGGCSMHLELGEDGFDERGYDAANGGPGTAAEVIARLYEQLERDQTAEGLRITDLAGVVLSGWTQAMVNTPSGHEIVIECTARVVGGRYNGLRVMLVGLGTVAASDDQFCVYMGNAFADTPKGPISIGSPSGDALAQAVGNAVQRRSVREQLAAFVATGTVPGTARGRYRPPPLSQDQILEELLAAGSSKEAVVGKLPRRWLIDYLLMADEGGREAIKHVAKVRCHLLIEEWISQDHKRLYGWMSYPNDALGGYPPQEIAYDKSDPWSVIPLLARKILS